MGEQETLETRKEKLKVVSPLTNLIEKDNEEIIKKAYELKGKNKIETIKNIFLFVINDLHYSGRAN